MILQRQLLPNQLSAILRKIGDPDRDGQPRYVIASHRPACVLTSSSTDQPVEPKGFACRRRQSLRRGICMDAFEEVVSTSGTETTSQIAY